MGIKALSLCTEASFLHYATHLNHVYHYLCFCKPFHLAENALIPARLFGLAWLGLLI